MHRPSLTEAQQRAARHHIGPALTLAIPGSGKTTTLVYRLEYLTTRHGHAPGDILTLTFSKAAATDMARRCAAHHGAGAPFTFMTIHRFAHGIYRKYLQTTGRRMQLLEDGAQKRGILSELYKKHLGRTPTEDAYESLSNEIGLLYNLRLKKGGEAPYPLNTPSLFEIASDYHRYKRDHRLFDFDDMLLSAMRILDANPKLCHAIRARYPFIQVDEAQDTSRLQFALIERLLTPERNLFLVADDDQSIYGFRGAFPEYLLDFEARYPGAAIYRLPENFRSDGYIVEAAAVLIASNEKRYAKTLTPAWASENRPALRTFDDLPARNAALSEALEVNHTEGKMTAILYRNKVSALSIADILEYSGMSCAIKDAPISECHHWMLGDLKAFLTLAMVPEDFESFRRIAFKTNGFISRELLDYVHSEQRRHPGQSVFVSLKNAPFLKPFQTRTMERLEADFHALSRLRPYDAIHFIETDLGYLAYLQGVAPRIGSHLGSLRTRLDAYKAIAKPLTTAAELFGRMDRIEAYLLEQDYSSSAPLTLSTIHAAKGLEYDHVFLIDANPDVFPSAGAKEGGLLEEERRLFYVALTRAKKQFTIFHAQFVNGHYNAYSLFVEALLAENCLERIPNRSGVKAAP